MTEPTLSPEGRGELLTRTVRPFGEALVKLPPGLKPIRLSEAEADALRDLLDDPNQPGQLGQEMRTIEDYVSMPREVKP